MMQSLYWIGLFLLVLIQVDAKKFFYEDSNSIQEVKGTDGYFQTSKKIRVVEFYSPFCSHCLKFKSIFASVAEDAIKKFGKDKIEIYGVSCGANRALCNKFDIEGYPSVYVIPKDAPVSQWKEIANLSGFHVRMIDQALTEAAKQAQQSPRSTPTTSNETGSSLVVSAKAAGAGNTTKSPIVSASLNNLVGHVISDASIMTKAIAGARAALQKESALDKYKRLHKATMGKVQPEKVTTVTHRRATLKKDKPKEPPPSSFPIIVTSGDTSSSSSSSAAATATTTTTAGNAGKVLTERQAMPTPTMNAHRFGTTAHTQRMEIIKKIVAASAPNKEQAMAQVEQGIVPFKILPAAEKMIEKIPFLKHLHVLSDEEELILDASLSFVESFRVSVFKRNGPLTLAEKSALEDWLYFVSVALPQEWGIHDLTNDLMANFDTVTESHDQLIEALDRHPLPRDTWSKSCGVDNFTCGFWKMLHAASIGIAAHRGGIDLIRSRLLRPHVEPISPLAAADALRGFMGNFFPCTRCAQHFVDRYDDCSNQRRCDRLSSDALKATDADWKEFAKWLWEFHNTVSVDILTQELEDEKRQLEQEGLPPKRDRVEMEEEVDKLWPSPALCFSCFNDDGSYNEDEVYDLLEETYWPGSDMRVGRKVWMIYDDPTEGGIALHLVLMLAALVIVALVSQLVSKSSVQDALIRAKRLGTTVKAGGKVRSA